MLGPLAVIESDAEIPLGAGKQRALLALLLLHRNEPVSNERLTDWLWQGEPPATAQKSLQVYVSGLRKVLGDGRLETQGRSYLLHVQAGELDLDRFEQLLEQARGCEPKAAAALLREALDLYRGEPLAELRYEQIAQAEIARLEELKLQTTEERIDAELDCGREQELVAELEGLVTAHPLRERLRGQLMLALYRTGRQADALAVYRQGTQLLDEELGLQPSPQLRELEQAILQHDPALGAPPLRTRLRSRVDRKKLAMLVGAALLLIAAAAAAADVELGSGQARITPVAGNELAAIDPNSGRVVAAIPVGDVPSAVTVGEGAVWVLNINDHTISKIDPNSLQLIKTFNPGTSPPTDLAAGDGALWVVNGDTGADPLTVSRIDPKTYALLQTIRPRFPKPVGSAYQSGQRSIVAGQEGVWIADPLDGALWRIDPRTDTAGLPAPGTIASSVTLIKGGMWAVTFDNKAVLLDQRSGRPRQQIKLTATALNDVTVGAGAVWAADPADGTLWKILPGQSPTTSTTPVGVGAHAVAYGAGSVWVANGFDGTILKVDPTTGKVVQTITVGGVPRAITYGDGRVWVTVGSSEALRSSTCAPIVTKGTGKPDYLITSDLPYLYGYHGLGLPMVDSIALVLRQHGFRAGRYTIGYQSCDDSTEFGGGGLWDPYRCAVNTRSFAGDPSVIGMIGPLNSGCAEVEIPIANRASLPIISPSNNWPGITQAGPGTTRGEPGIYYPTGVRTYFRVAPTQGDEGAADAVLAKQLGAKRVYVLTDGIKDPYGLDIAGYFKRAAQRLGLTVAGFAPWVDNKASYRQLSARVERTRPDAIFLGGIECQTCGELIKQLRSTLGGRVAIIAPDGFWPPSGVYQLAGAAAIGMYVSDNGAPSRALPPAARRFLAQLRKAYPQTTTQYTDFSYVPPTAQATEALLAAIAHSNGTRASVVQELHHLHFSNGPLGPFHFDSNGDPTVNQTLVERVIKNPPPNHSSEGVIDRATGGIIYRVLTAPRKLTKNP
jgi:DNA-binding SARP family transcriptional activator/ABC-type branched-subunit amino acid transport system substrate-binding protein/DNA-binding beta-propeller fold protein YncE